MEQNELNKLVEQEWSELGFYYDRDDSSKTWRLYGTNSALLKFSELLRVYSINPGNEPISEHEHYGPYSYLKLMTWTDAGIDKQSIHGTLQDIGRLARIVESNIANLKTGQCVEISNQFVTRPRYGLELHCVETCDPSSLDKSIIRSR